MGGVVFFGSEFEMFLVKFEQRRASGRSAIDGSCIDSRLHARSDSGLSPRAFAILRASRHGRGRARRPAWPQFRWRNPGPPNPLRNEKRKGWSGARAEIHGPRGIVGREAAGVTDFLNRRHGLSPIVETIYRRFANKVDGK